MRTQTQQIRRLDQAEFARWRQRTLAAAGFDPRLAARLADDARFDLHAVLELVDAGCPPLLAARILAPLARDGESW